MFPKQEAFPAANLQCPSRPPRPPLTNPTYHKMTLQSYFKIMNSNPHADLAEEKNRLCTPALRFRPCSISSTGNESVKRSALWSREPNCNEICYRRTPGPKSLATSRQSQPRSVRRNINKAKSPRNRLCSIQQTQPNNSTSHNRFVNLTSLARARVNHLGPRGDVLCLEMSLDYWITRSHTF